MGDYKSQPWRVSNLASRFERKRRRDRIGCANKAAGNDSSQTSIAAGWRAMNSNSSARIRKDLGERLKAAVPFGLGQVKPKHFRDMAKVTWTNRDNLRYAWKVLSRGVCDGCALGVAGFHDWTIPGVHLCMTRLNLLRLNTMPAMDPRQLEDVSKLASMSNAQLRELGRLPCPMLREKGATGFR